MSTHKHFDRICCVVLPFTLLLTILFVHAESFGIKKASSSLGYETRLFDTSSVHTLDIVMDNWDDFLVNCKNEEYSSCTLVIDNETYKNVAIRAKGNTSLTQVESYGNNRYSFKIEFDRYDSSKTYYGLDKLCLNNIIQDNTYMKDYLTYQMMAQMGVASPLCSYVYITVNGEEWGLYLAVEGVEEAFLQRNYGNDYGELYKPDSMGLGGGRGNGKKFLINEFWSDSESENNPLEKITQSSQQLPNDAPQDNANDNGQLPDRASVTEGREPDGNQPPELPNGKSPFHPGPGERQGGGMGSDDVLLKYIDDDADSYSNIFDNAKTAISNKDKTRLIEALEKLSRGEELNGTVDVEAAIRYFVVHNFVLNFDSYTGSMIHNYYLYEKDGQMQMIPWDYNLAFGGFQSMDSAASLVNYPIDSPVSGGNMEDRPMIAWIFANEEYTELYHRYFSEFISAWFENGRFENTIDSVSAMISPYVRKDPTKFCTYEEFETGVSTLKEFCLLRAQSIEGQLNGSIGLTSDTQQNSEMVDAGDLQISDMGSMNHSMGGGVNKRKGGMQDQQGTTDNNESQQTPHLDDEDADNSSSSEQTSSNHLDNTENSTANTTPPQRPAGQPQGNGDVREVFQTETYGEALNADGELGEIQNAPERLANSSMALIWIVLSGSILAAGSIFALVFQRRKS